jgi:hypothetical protein
VKTPSIESKKWQNDDRYKFQKYSARKVNPRKRILSIDEAVHGSDASEPNKHVEMSEISKLYPRERVED